MKIKCFELGPIGTNAYLVWNDDANQAVLIDTPHDAFDIITQFLKDNNLTLAAILITHGHWDHIADLKRIKDNLNVDIYAHSGDLSWIQNPAPMNAMLPPELHFEGTSVDHIINDGQTLTLADIQFEVRAAPGHAPGSVIFYNQSNNAAFVGDVIFKDSIGRTDLPGGSFNTLESSIREKVYSLPDNTTLYPGHGSHTNVAYEKQNNSFVRPN